MVLPGEGGNPPGGDLLHLPLPQGDKAGTRWLIAAVLSAGKDGCNCESCQLLKKFGNALSAAMLEEAKVG